MLLFYQTIDNAIRLKIQLGWGHWAFHFTSPQSFIRPYFNLFAHQLWGLLLNFAWLVQQVDCPKVLNTYCNLQKELFFVIYQ